MTSCWTINSEIIEVDAEASLAASGTSSASMTTMRSNRLFRNHGLADSSLPVMVHALLIQAIEIIIVSAAEMMPGREFMADPSVVTNLLEALRAVAVLLLAVLIIAALVAVAVPEATPATSATTVSPVVDFIVGHVICLLLLLLQVEEQIEAFVAE